MAWEVQVQWRQLWLAAVGADEMEIVLLRVLLINAVAFRMLPDVTLFASNRMCAIVEVLAVLSAHCTIEDPLILLFG